MSERHSEAAFETVIEAQLLANGCVAVDQGSFDRERAIFPEPVLAFIRTTQPKWARLEALHGEKTGEQILGDLCKWMDANGALATLRHGFKCYGEHCTWPSSSGARAEPGTGGALRREPPGADPATAFLAAFGAVARCYPEPERHPRRYLELKNPLTGQRSKRRASSTCRTAIHASRSSSSSGEHWCTSL